MNIYYKVRGEPDKGKYAVASVTLNRVASKHYPDTICDVVFQKAWDYLRNRYVSAFSWTELDAPVSANARAWQKAADPDCRKPRGPEPEGGLVLSCPPYPARLGMPENLVWPTGSAYILQLTASTRLIGHYNPVRSCRIAPIIDQLLQDSLLTL